jgi:hypothetical protein
MTVAHDERIDLRCINLEQIHVAVDGLGRPTEIQQEGALLITALRLQQQRQPPFAVQRPRRIRRPAGLRLHPAHRLRLEEDIGGAVDQHASAELVDRRHLDRTRLGHLDTGKPTGRGSQRETGGHLQGIASIEIWHGILLEVVWEKPATFATSEIQGRLTRDVNRNGAALRIAAPADLP